MKISLINCRLIDVCSGSPVSNATIIIDGNRIAAVGSKDSISVPADAETLDLAGRSVLPGMIDLHLHLTYYYKRSDVTVEGNTILN
jgi:imidazolonepropionase-like amidohydrolase